MVFIWGLWCATEDIPEDMGNYGSLSQELWKSDSIKLKEGIAALL